MRKIILLGTISLIILAVSVILFFSLYVNKHDPYSDDLSSVQVTFNSASEVVKLMSVKLINRDSTACKEYYYGHLERSDNYMYRIKSADNDFIEMQGDFKYFEKKAAQSNIDISAIRDDIKTYYAFYYKKFFNSFYTYMSRECNYCLWEYTQSGQLTKGSYSDLFINNNSDKAKQLLISKARLDFTTLYYNYIFYLAFCS